MSCCGQNALLPQDSVVAYWPHFLPWSGGARWIIFCILHQWELNCPSNAFTSLQFCSSSVSNKTEQPCQFLFEMCFVTKGCSCCRMNWAQYSRCGLPSAEGRTLLAQGQLVCQDTRPFSAKLFPRCRTWHFPLLNTVNFLLVYFSSLPRSPRMAAQPSGVSAAPPGSALSAGLQQTCRGCSLSCHSGCWWRCWAVPVLVLTHSVHLWSRASSWTLCWMWWFFLLQLSILKLKS